MRTLDSKKVETIKTIVIAMLISGLIAFIGGVSYQNKRTAEINSAVNAVKSVQPVVSTKK